MAEPARRALEEIERFKLEVRKLDDTGFKKEVARLAVGQSENAEVRDTIAQIAFDEFGEAGKETVLQIWAGMQAATLNAHNQVARATTTGLLGFQHSKSPIIQSLENALMALDLLNLDCRYDLFHDKIIVKGYDSGQRRGDALEDLDNIGLKVRQAILMKFLL